MSDDPIRFDEAESFSQLFNQSHLIVFRYIYGLIGGPKEHVEDLTADTFMRAWKGRRRFRGTKGSAVSWLIRIARNLVIDDYRRNKPHSTDIDIDAINVVSHKAPPEDQVLIEEQMRILLICLQTINIPQRDMIVLRYVLGWRVKDIAEHLGMVENTVSVNIRRTLNKIRQKWPHEIE